MSRREEIVWSTGDRPGASPKIGSAKFWRLPADIVIALDRDGTVQSILTNQSDQNLGCLDHWVGRDLKEFLTEECHPKLDSALASVSQGRARAARGHVELNHIDNASWEFPIRYSVFDTGAGEPILMVGRDLGPVAEVQQQLVKTQLELEKDYEAQREAETRFRVLMGETRDALVFVDAKSGRIEDISEAAGVMLGVGTEGSNRQLVLSGVRGSAPGGVPRQLERCGREAARRRWSQPRGATGHHVRIHSTPISRRRAGDPACVAWKRTCAARPSARNWASTCGRSTTADSTPWSSPIPAAASAARTRPS